MYEIGRDYPVGDPAKRGITELSILVWNGCSLFWEDDALFFMPRSRLPRYDLPSAKYSRLPFRPNG